MNFSSPSVQSALIKTSVVGNVSKETGIHREKEKHKQNTEPHLEEVKEEQSRSRWHNGFPTPGFHHLQSAILSVFSSKNEHGGQ